MIYTLTLNPSVDVYSDFDEFELGKINKPKNQVFEIGGKGINVSNFLLQLGVQTVPIVVVGGFVGAYIEETLKESFQPIVFYQSHCSRICYKIYTDEETAINPSAMTIGSAKEEIRSFLSTLKQEDILIVSGSGTIEDYQYVLQGVQARLVLDVSGRIMCSLANLHAWLVKPNTEELSEVDLNARRAYDKLLTQADIILHTQGSEGATLVTSQIMYHIDSKASNLKTTVGCGDAFLAGFLKSYLDHQSILSCFHFASECAYKRGKEGKLTIS